MNKLIDIYNGLLDAYGRQGWWPLCSLNECNALKSGSIKGYHPNDYSYPKNDLQRFEICAGAILAQNTSWLNAEKSVKKLYEKNLLNPKKIIENESIIAELIKPSGYFNLKSKYLINFSKFYIGLNGGVPKRHELIKIIGIGNETADSILLYAYNQPEFIASAYSKRILENLGILKSNDYPQIKAFFESNLPKDYELFQEFHSLIVEHAKRHYSKKPYGINDFLNKD